MIFPINVVAAANLDENEPPKKKKKKRCIFKHVVPKGINKDD